MTTGTIQGQQHELPLGVFPECKYINFGHQQDPVNHQINAQVKMLQYPSLAPIFQILGLSSSHIFQFSNQTKNSNHYGSILSQKHIVIDIITDSVTKLQSFNRQQVALLNINARSQKCKNQLSFLNQHINKYQMRQKSFKTTMAHVFLVQVTSIHVFG